MKKSEHDVDYRDNSTNDGRSDNNLQEQFDSDTMEHIDQFFGTLPVESDTSIAKQPVQQSDPSPEENIHGGLTKSSSKGGKEKKRIATIITLFVGLAIILIIGLWGWPKIFSGPSIEKASTTLEQTTKISTTTTTETIITTSSVSEEPTKTIDDFSKHDDIAYVMIYNPGIYKEDADVNQKMNTGSFGNWINISMFRGEQKGEGSQFKFFSQHELEKRAEGIAHKPFGQRLPINLPEYQVGDSEMFYYDDGETHKALFICSHLGSKCCLWNMDDQEPDRSQMERIVEEFDNTIYPADVETFGTPRYADIGGIIHILFHPMEEGTLGYFWSGDIYTSEEVTDAEAEKYGANRDHAIIHINSKMLSGTYNEQILFSTLAHELQHLINCTDYADYNHRDFSPTWINEAMSGYIEERLYPGVKDLEGHYDEFANSNLIRHGQSLYNFDTDYPDIGVYGSVFLYSQYLENMAGEKVFYDFHKYWRTTLFGELSDAYALYSAIPSSKIQDIDNKYDYPSKLLFENLQEKMMSKLTLDFYLSLLKYDTSDPQTYQKVVAQTLLYDEINPADIEGGGRVIAATKDGRFDIPDNADTPLVYIGFDSNFNQITDLIVH